MDDLKRRVIFYHVVDSGSFSAAARQLGIAKSVVSQHVSLLEAHVQRQLGGRAFHFAVLRNYGISYPGRS